MKPLREFFLRGTLYFYEVSKKYDFFLKFFVWFTRDGEIEGLRRETSYPQFRALMFSRLTCDVTN